MHMDLRKLKIYGGNYDQFMKTRGEQVEAQMKQYNWEQEQIAHMKEYIARFVLVSFLNLETVDDGLEMRMIMKMGVLLCHCGQEQTVQCPLSIMEMADDSSHNVFC